MSDEAIYGVTEVDEHSNYRGGSFSGSGIVGILRELLKNWLHPGQQSERHMRLIESLPLGGKRQLLLVSCGSEQYLVGGGVDTVQTIVRVGDALPNSGGENNWIACE